PRPLRTPQKQARSNHFLTPSEFGKSRWFPAAFSLPVIQTSDAAPADQNTGHTENCTSLPGG
ncbi:hypothetical protein, partial [Xanthomonas oryzae]|uniref:hypothetical protein n=1 Tax=Xanthomonas oryzae TaxID=347 RepID=UPI001C6849F3